MVDEGGAEQVPRDRTALESPGGVVEGARQGWVVVGEGVTVPMRLKFDHLDEEDRPRSGNAAFSTAWQHDIDPGDAVEQIIHRWRMQLR